jgi:hypothetical protein
LFVYRIARLKAQPNPTEYTSRPQILARHLARCIFNVGDKVKFKKPKRNPAYGYIARIDNDFSKITWAHGGLTPMFIHVDVIKGNTLERVKTNDKKLIYVEGVKA